MAKSMKGQDRFRPLEEGVGIELDKHISVRDDLDAINAAEKRIFKK